MDKKKILEIIKNFYNAKKVKFGLGDDVWILFFEHLQYLAELEQDSKGYFLEFKDGSKRYISEMLK